MGNSRLTVSRIIIGSVDCKSTLTLDEVDKLERSRGKRGIGWHYLVFPNQVVPGRSLDLPGNHTVGFNADSIGIGLVGGVCPKSKRFGPHYAAGQQDLAMTLARGLTIQHGVPVFFQHQLIRTKAPYFEATL